MAVISFTQLPDSARFWVFPLVRPLNADESKIFLDKVDRFMVEWVSHQMEVTVARDWKYNQFLLVGADESRVGISGCSNDSLFRTVKMIQQDMGFPFADSSFVFYRDGEKVNCVSRDEFRDLVKKGQLTADTVVFNNTIQDMGAYRQGLWEIAMKNSWHGEAFPLQNADLRV